MPIFDPQINAQTAQSLADLMGGGSAAQYMGMQQAMQQEMNPINRDISLADLERTNLGNEGLSIKNMFDRQMNPMLLQIKEADVREAASKTPEHFQVMRNKDKAGLKELELKNRKTAGTLDTDIAAGNSKNQVQMIKDMGSMISNTIAQIGGLPPDAQRQALLQTMSQYGFDKNPRTAAMWEQFVKMDPNQLITYAVNFAESVKDFNPEHLAALEKQREQDDAAMARTRVSANATLGAASMRKKDIESEMELARMKQRLENRIMELTQKQAMRQASPAEQEELKQLTQYALSLRSLGTPQIDVPGIERTNPVDDAMRGLFPNSTQRSGPTSNTPKKWNPTTGKWE